MQHVLHIFGDQASAMTQAVVEKFQNRCMFGSDEKSSLMTFMVCGAAILMGTHYPGSPFLKTLKLLGDTHVDYKACERTSQVEITNGLDDRIQLALGVANILWFEDGHTEFSCEVVAKRYYEYAEFATMNEIRMRKVMIENSRSLFIWGGIGKYQKMSNYMNFTVIGLILENEKEIELDRTYRLIIFT